MAANYETFRRLVFAKKWTIAQLRCDELPSAEMLEAMDEYGLDCWERFVSRLVREADVNLTRMAFGK